MNTVRELSEHFVRGERSESTVSHSCYLEG